MRNKAESRSIAAAARDAATEARRPARRLARIGVRRTLVGALLAVSASALGLAAHAHGQAGWPTRPLRLIVPYAAGGHADTLGRLVADRLSERLGQSVVVENRAGASAVPGTLAAARSPADGYTFLLAPLALIAITPCLRKVPYDPDTDFAPVACVCCTEGVEAARSSLRPVDRFAQATSGDARNAQLPDMLALREQELDAHAAGWLGVFAPRGTPPEIVARMSVEIEHAVDAPGVREQMLQLGQRPDYANPTAFARRIREDSVFYRTLIDQGGLRTE